MCIRVLIADDQSRARRSLRALLTTMRWSTWSHIGKPTSAGCLPVEIVGEAENGQETLAQVETLHPDVVVMDLHPQLASSAQHDGAATIRSIKRRWPTVRIVVLTLFTTDRAAVLESGADAFLLKGCSTDELLEAVWPGLSAL